MTTLTRDAWQCSFSKGKMLFHCVLASWPPNPSWDTFPCSGFMQYGLCRVLRSHTGHRDPRPPSARTREPELFQGGTVRVKTGRPRDTTEPRFRAVVLTPKWLLFLVWSRGGRPAEKGRITRHNTVL